MLGSSMLLDGFRFRIGISSRFSTSAASPTIRRNSYSSSNSRKSRPSGRGRLSCTCQFADLAPATSAAYDVLLLAGGLFAFNKSNSKGSLFGGLTGAALMATACFLMQAQETRAYGEAIGFGSSLLFSSVFGIRLAATRKLIPAGPLLGLSVSALAVFIAAYLENSL